MLHVFASTCTLYKYASCPCLNSAMKFYFRMELISSCRYLIGNASFSVSHCAVGPTYLVLITIVYIQVLATFCTTFDQVEQKVPKLTNLLNP